MQKLRRTMPGRAATAATLTVIALLGSGASAQAAPTTLRARIGGALGIVRAIGGPDIAAAPSVLEAYHGGPVMHDVTVHTIFWAPSGYHFSGPPASGVLGYEAMVQRFWNEVGSGAGRDSSVYSILREYPDTTGAVGDAVAYSSAADSIDDTDPYPASGQCASPNGIVPCITDVQLQDEIDRVVQKHAPTARGLNNLWFIFLPPGVDTCVDPGSCGSNAYGGYHSVSDGGHGITIYSVIPDLLIEQPIPPGADPQGNPDAEATIDTTAHEAIEAMTDPEGTGWMDPNGSEVADKCEYGPEVGTPLGFSWNGSPFNQLIGSEGWLIQEMWSNAKAGCVVKSSTVTPPPSLAKVHLTQFSRSVYGSIGMPRAGISVRVALRRAGTIVARASARTRASGAWGPVTLRSLTHARAEAFGDDRDAIFVDYGHGGPSNDAILTGNGGNAFTESGWTGWFDLDHGYSVFSELGVSGVLVSPCFQVGVVTLRLNGHPQPSPTQLCGTETDVAPVPTAPIGTGSRLSFQSVDNRAVTASNPNGALISMTVPVGEANSVSALDNSQILFAPSGFPTCSANLRAQRVSCTGLVPGSRYTLTRQRGHATARAKANRDGNIEAAQLGRGQALRGGDLVALTNAAGRRLTTLHVAHLRVHLLGSQTRVASGTCEAGNYYGPPLSTPPTNDAVGAPGIAGTGKICPPSGSAHGLSIAHIEQTDDQSGGTTVTSVPHLSYTAPSNGATLYGAFTALAGPGVTTSQHAVIASGASVSLKVRSASGAVAFAAENVNVAGGVHVHALPTGTYGATWVVTDLNGDTRTVVTHFVEA